MCFLAQWIYLVCDRGENQHFKQYLVAIPSCIAVHNTGSSLWQMTLIISTHKHGSAFPQTSAAQISMKLESQSLFLQIYLSLHTGYSFLAAAFLIAARMLLSSSLFLLARMWVPTCTHTHTHYTKILCWCYNSSMMC